ncbi:MAG: DUF1080 domain-containing protein [Verrucomicrobiota bacterium]
MPNHPLALFPTVGFAALLGSCAKAETPSSQQDLLGAKALADWEFISATPTAIDTVCVPGADGELAIPGKPAGNLATRTTYENYQLHFEWRWPANTEGSNGGVLVHINSGPTGGTPWPVCFQAQLKLDHAGDLLPMDSARFVEKLTSDAKPPQLAHTGNNSEKPLGEWNTGDIVCQGNNIEIRINGVLQNRVSQCSPASGKIGFQLEGAPFELRHVRIQSNTEPARLILPLPVRD